MFLAEFIFLNSDVKFRAKKKKKSFLVLPNFGRRMLKLLIGGLGWKKLSSFLQKNPENISSFKTFSTVVKQFL